VQAQRRDGRGEDQIDLIMAFPGASIFWYLAILLPLAISITKIEERPRECDLEVNTYNQDE
jgi:hypothetical protein